MHSIGDRITIEGPNIALEQTDNLCIHALQYLLHYAVLLREGVRLDKQGLS